MPKNKIKQEYKYRIANSILQGENEYELEQAEYFLLYNFFVTYSVCENQSFQKRSFIDYGWSTNNIIHNDKTDTELGTMFKNNIKFNITFFNEKISMKDLFNQNNLNDGILNDYDTERTALAKTSGSNQYIKLFYHIRNCLAHGKFMLKYSSSNEKMILFQDNNNNVTARMVIKLQTLINLVTAIDINGLIVKKENSDTNENVA